MLQETHSTSADENLWKCEWGGNILFFLGNSRSNGVAILFHHKFKFELCSEHSNSHGRFLLTEIKVKENSFLLAKVYAPTKDEPVFFDGLFSTLSDFSSLDYILAGDWNVVLDNQIDKNGGPKHANKLSRDRLKSYINDFALCDIYRESNPSRKAYTRIQSQPYTATRLDFFLIDINLRHHIKSTDIDSSVYSDHKIVTITLNLNFEEWGKGYWKLNSDILLDDKYVALIKQTITDFRLNNPEGHASSHILWDSLKCVIRGETIKYCTLKKKILNEKRLSLESKLAIMESRLVNCTEKDRNNILSSVNNTQNELNNLIVQKAKGAAVRSRARWMEYGEKNNKYFLGLEKRNREKKNINCLKNAQGILINEKNNVLKELVHYYETLYRNNELFNESQCYDFVKMTSCPTINEAQKLHCDSPITENECLKAICQLANSKSPGPDGFSVEFYKCFWDDLKHPFMECLKYSINKDQLCKSQYEGVITLLPKPGKDLLLACNYRPITLLNCDYKIIAKVINNRLWPLLPFLVSQDQSGFIKGRNIGDNIRLMFDIIDYANCKNVPSAVLSVDLQKAFDSLNWSFIFAMLRIYGFGDFLIGLIKMIYKEPKCCIINNNF